MEKSEQINELAAALSIAQGELENASKSSDNPHFKSRYADLAEVINCVRPVFSRHGLAFTQFVSYNAGIVSVETVLMHKGGQYISGIISAPVSKQDAQGVGSATTYCRRYSLAAVAGLAQEDDDANSAVGHGSKKEDAQKRPPNDETTEFTPDHQRVKDALHRLYGDDKNAALNKIEEMTSFQGRDGNPVKGVRNYLLLSGKRLEILADKLEKLSSDKRAAPNGDTGDDIPF